MAIVDRRPLPPPPARSLHSLAICKLRAVELRRAGDFPEYGGRGVILVKDFCLDVLREGPVFSYLEARPLCPHILHIPIVRVVRTIPILLPQIAVALEDAASLDLPVYGGDMDAQLRRDLFNRDMAAEKFLDDIVAGLCQAAVFSFFMVSTSIR